MKYLTLILTLGLSMTAQSSSELTRAVSDYTQFLGTTSNATQIMKSSPLNRGKEMRPKTVLKGVFYFGGSDVKRKLLSSSTQRFLCESGFTSVYSVYDKPKSSNVQCSGNSIDYRHIGEARGQDGGPSVRKLLEDIYEVIHSQGQLGPIYLHCWYGVHASNTIAQIVLKQFCGKSDDELARNWDKVDLYDSLGAKGMRKNIQKIYDFSVYSDLEITPSEQAIICH